jgi:TRAP transporter TAXI family solute receptor
VLLPLLLSLGSVFTVAAQDVAFFQIGSGPAGETRFLLGSLIANALSNPPGSRPCDRGGSCGVPGLVAVAKSTGGAIANVDGLAAGRLDAALVRADIAYWARQGSGPFKEKGPVTALRGIAMLYSDTVHLVVRRGSGIHSVHDLKGRRVSLGARDSGALVLGRLLLGAYGLHDSQVKLSYFRPGAAADALAAGQLDAFLVVDGQAAPAVAELARTTEIALLPLAGPEMDRLRAGAPFLNTGVIPAGTYAGIDQPVPTVEIGVMLATRANQPAPLIQEVTRALWNPTTQRLLTEGHARGRLIHLAFADLGRLGVPLHAGAAAYYAEAGAAQ